MAELKCKQGENGLYGFVDENDNWVIEPKFDNAWDFSKEGIALVMMNYNFGYIKTNGEFLLEPVHSDASKFFNGLAIVREEDYGKYGVINEEGEWVIAPQLAQIEVYPIGEVDDDEIHDFVENKSHFTLYDDSNNSADCSFDDPNWVQTIQDWINDDYWED